VSNKGSLIIVSAAALFGLLGPLSRFAYDAGMEPAAFIAWRSCVGLVGTGAFVAWRLRGGRTHLVRPRELGGRALASLLIAALLGLGVNLGLFIGFDLVTIALALLGFYTYPAIVAAVSVVTGRERLDMTRALALGLATLGMIAVVASQLDPSQGIRFDALGFGLCLGAAVCQAGYVLISRDGYRAVPSEQAMTVVMVVVAVGAILFSVVGGHTTALGLPLERPSVLPLLLFTGILTAAVPSILLLSGIRMIGGTRTGILMLVEPVVGVVLAAVLLGEALAPIQLVGAIAILTAAVLLQRGSADPTAPQMVPDDAAALHVPGGP
jgi:drug/metabolite transporter, DME family